MSRARVMAGVGNVLQRQHHVTPHVTRAARCNASEAAWYAHAKPRTTVTRNSGKRKKKSRARAKRNHPPSPSCPPVLPIIKPHSAQKEGPRKKRRRAHAWSPTKVESTSLAPPYGPNAPCAIAGVTMPSPLRAACTSSAVGSLGTSTITPGSLLRDASIAARF